MNADVTEPCPRSDDAPGARLRTGDASPLSRSSNSTVVDVVEWGELSEADLACWEQLRQSNPEFTQPFFSSRFAEAVQVARGDVLVAVFRQACSATESESDEQAGEKRATCRTVGFFPFHRIGRVGVPVGRFLNDAQNVIGLAAEAIDWTEVMKACDVRAFNLHAVIAPTQRWVASYRMKTVKAYRADFLGDSKAFLEKLEREHRTIDKQGQKTRKLGREVGTLRLEVDCQCPDVLRQAVEWKSLQYQRTHILDLFHPEWTRKLIDILCSDTYATSVNSFAVQPLRGLVSVLWAGDVPVAAHVGMVERGRLHYWFPAYDPAYARYSPGTALFTELVRAGTAHGIDCIDMGYGEQPYKQKQTATTTEVAYGTITDSAWHRFVFASEAKMVNLLKQMPMKESVKRAWRRICPTAGIKKLK